MKLLMTADTVGGVWTYALELSRALTAAGSEVLLAALGGPASPAQRAEAAAVERLTLVEGDFRLEWMDDPWEDVRRAGEWLLQWEREFRPDVIHLNDYAHGALPWRAPVLVVGHSCVLSWWEAVKGVPAPEPWDRYRREVKLGLAGADLVAAPTRAMLKALERHYGPFAHTKVLPNGRDPEQFRPERKEPFILSAGRMWDEAKNLAVLDQAAAGLPWPVEVAGDCRHPMGGEVAPRHVRCLGRLSTAELRGCFGRASIYALPARYEPFGLSILEAAFSGCALVLGDIPSLREVWEDAACWVRPDDPEGLRTTLQTLIDSPAERKALAERARVRAFEFTPQRMAAAYGAAYRWLIETAGAEPVEAEGEALCVS